MSGRGTPQRNIRISQDLWDAALAATAAEGTSVAVVINDFLRRTYMPDETTLIIACEDPLIVQGNSVDNRATRLAQLRAHLEAGDLSHTAERAIELEIELLELVAS